MPCLGLFTLAEFRRRSGRSRHHRRRVHDACRSIAVCWARASTSCRRACASCTISAGVASGLAAPTWSAADRWRAASGRLAHGAAAGGPRSAAARHFRAVGDDGDLVAPVRQRAVPVGAIRATATCCASASGPPRSSSRLWPRRRAWRCGSTACACWACRCRPAAPDRRTFEGERDGRYHFEVESRLPLIGLLVRYGGWLMPQGVQARTQSAAAREPLWSRGRASVRCRRQGLDSGLGSDHESPCRWPALRGIRPAVDRA